MRQSTVSRSFVLCTVSATALAIAWAIAKDGASIDTHSPDLRVVSLHDTTTEIVVGMGATDLLCAVVRPTHLTETALAAIEGLPQLPSGSLSIESLLGLKPDRILGTDVIAERLPELAEKISQEAQVLLIDPQGIEGLLADIRHIGAALDRVEEAESYVDTLRSQWPRAPADSDPVRVFLYDCCDPPFTAGGRGPINDVLRSIGATNVFDDLDQDWCRVSWESVIERAPEVIVVHDYAMSGQRDLSAKRTFLFDQPFLSSVPAILEDRVIGMPLSLSLEGPRVLEALDWLRPAISKAREQRSHPGPVAR